MHDVVDMRGACDTRLLMKLAEYLKDKGLTDQAFAGLIGRSRTSVSRLRRNETRPDWKTVERIHVASGGAVTPNDFLSDNQPSEDTAE
jgi:transcriptional regulator with XRE-family HTH domain